jgi:uncharacterized protein (TIGR02757 family)
MFSRKNNIEISGFLAATISWGQRTSIIKNAKRLMSLMDNNPYDFIMNANEKDYKCFDGFCHRTFNSDDTVCFLKALANIYQKHGGLEKFFTKEFIRSKDIRQCLTLFRNVFFELPHPDRTRKHLADISRGASAKRLNMFLRWMVRRDNKGVDFGLWRQIEPSALYIPLDLHTGNVARSLGLLYRKPNDWKAVEELTACLRNFDADDPVKYDFALFGMGVF